MNPELSCVEFELAFLFGSDHPVVGFEGVTEIMRKRSNRFRLAETGLVTTRSMAYRLHKREQQKAALLSWDYTITVLAKLIISLQFNDCRGFFFYNKRKRQHDAPSNSQATVPNVENHCPDSSLRIWYLVVPISWQMLPGIAIRFATAVDTP
ncbi:uncharacterized protein LY79DRAFT_95360 [Colletotrichum navitas]|uniref:Uncharacterized protein n=1 Tax=Colletotrichum navitas TaxID=681940 RepID=A0AAD8V8N4_9PEZI|nr:uncharacterized protein LY79DRAFT_95360 [Colletotrichum navitas]KAK1595881.1 hypothetical protein LY79DRAFT_95360 [Colletotrichum navitas]